MRKHLIQAGAVCNHGGGQIAQIPVPEKAQWQSAQSLCQADPPVGTFFIGCQVQRSILKPMQNKQ